MRKAYLAFPVLLAFAFTVPVACLRGLNIGVDVYFHLQIARSWANGQLGMFSSVVMNENHFPYPPLFHFLLVPSVWLGCVCEWALVLQVVLLPLAVASFMFLVYKVLGDSSAFFGGLLVLGSLAYLDRIVQPQPQALDFVLLPLAILFFLRVENKSFLCSSLLMVWNHGLVSLSALGGTLLEKLRNRDWKTLGLLLLGSSFIIGVSLIYLASGLGNYGSRIDTDQEFLFWHNPLWMPRYLGLLIVGFGVAFYRVVQWARGKPLSPLTKVSFLSIASMSIMIPVWADRWVQYCTIPLALLIMEHFKNSDRLARHVWGSVIGMFAVLMVADWFFL